MASLILPSSLRRQPQYITGVDTTNPLCRGLTFLATPGIAPVDAVSRSIGAAPGTAGTSYSYTFGANGRGTRLLGPTVNGFAWTSVQPILPSSTTYTIGSLAAPLSTPTTANQRETIFFEGDEVGAPLHKILLLAHSTNQGAYSAGRFSFFEWTDPTYLAGAQTDAGVLDGNVHLLVGVRDTTAAACKVFIDGVNRTSATTGSGSASATIKNNAYIGNTNNPTGASRGAQFPVYLVAVWNRVLSDDEIAVWNRDPWQLFAPQQRRVYVGTVSAATTYTYTATGGVTLAGAATPEKSKDYTATGGATLAGAATTSYTAGTVTYEYTATGGLVLAGAAVPEKAKAYLATGGMTLAGAATTAYQAYQFARPSSDTDAVGWLPSTPGDLYAMIDEVAASDADYIYTTTVNTDAEVALSSVVDPTSSSDHIIRVRARAPNGGQVKVGLYQTTTLIAEWTESLTTSFETYPHTLAGAEADAITNYGALRLRFTALAA